LGYGTPATRILQCTVSVYICIYIYHPGVDRIRIFPKVSINMDIFLSFDILVYFRMIIHPSIHACMNTYQIYIYIYIYIHIYIYTHIYICIYMYIYIYIDIMRYIVDITSSMTLYILYTISCPLHIYIYVHIHIHIQYTYIHFGSCSLNYQDTQVLPAERRPQKRCRPCCGGRHLSCGHKSVDFTGF
jgi:hypothetical protein